MRGRTTGAAVVLVAAVAATLTVVWAAAVPRPPRPILVATPTRTITTHGDPPVDLAPRSEIDAAAFGGSRDSASALSVVIGWLAVAVVAGAVLALLVVLVRAVLRELRERRAIEADDSTGPTPDRVADALATDAEGRLVTLAGGTPAEGIVAVWTRLEETLRAAGVPLPASRTSTETTVSTLSRFTLEEGTLRELAALYREASWSHHPLTEADRDRAEAALRVLDRHLVAARDSGRSAPSGAGRG